MTLFYDIGSFDQVNSPNQFKNPSAWPAVFTDINVSGDGGARAPVLLTVSHSTRQAFEKGGGLPSPSPSK